MSQRSPVRPLAGQRRERVFWCAGVDCRVVSCCSAGERRASLAYFEQWRERVVWRAGVDCRAMSCCSGDERRASLAYFGQWRERVFWCAGVDCRAMSCNNADERRASLAYFVSAWHTSCIICTHHVATARMARSRCAHGRVRFAILATGDCSLPIWFCGGLSVAAAGLTTHFRNVQRERLPRRGGYTIYTRPGLPSAKSSFCQRLAACHTVWTYEKSRKV
jgi:hypothetical protein